MKQRMKGTNETWAEPLVAMKAGGDVYVKCGSPVTLQCSVWRYLHEPRHLSWHRNGSLLVNVSVSTDFDFDSAGRSSRPSLRGAPRPRRIFFFFFSLKTKANSSSYSPVDLGPVVSVLFFLYPI